MTPTPMVTYEWSWPLQPEKCPFDIELAMYLIDRHNSSVPRRGLVFHFGTGEHHALGSMLAAIDMPVIGITASREEYAAYMDLVIERPEVAKTYKCEFGDIYLTDPRTLPMLDVISLPHLCEFPDERRAAYGALTDLELVEALKTRLAPGGIFVFYLGSCAWDRAVAVVKAAGLRPVAHVGCLGILDVPRTKSGWACRTCGETVPFGAPHSDVYP